MKFPTPHGIATARGDQQLARECYRIALRQADGEGTSARPDPTRKLLSIQAPAPADPLTPLDDQTESLQIGPQADQLVLVGKLLPEEVKRQLLHLLREDVHVFAWSPKDLVGIPKDIVVHKLNISPDTPPVKQKKRPFASEPRVPFFYD